MVNNKLLTIVIPVYKVEKFIRQCLDSVIVLKEQMELLEVIVVNDGTPDYSADIAREYAVRFPDTIKIIDKENGGHGSAWNVGLSLAAGKYIRFLDSDDWLTNLSDFITKLMTLDVDLVFTHMIQYIEESGEKVRERNINVECEKVYSISDFSFIKTSNYHYMYNFHRCTYRTSMLKPELPLFVEKVSFDDSILFIAPLLLAKSLCFLDLELYIYRIHEGQSVDKKVEMKHAYDYVLIGRKLMDFISNHTVISDNQKEQRDVILRTWVWFRFSSFTSLPYMEYKRVMKDFNPILMNIYPLISKSRMVIIYNYTPSFISWALFKLLKIR